MNYLKNVLDVIIHYGRVNPPEQPLWNEFVDASQKAVDKYESDVDTIQIGGVQGFVERYYPDYHKDDNIARNEDLQKIVDLTEENGDTAWDILIDEFAGDRELAKVELSVSNEFIYQEAIKGYINSLK